MLVIDSIGGYIG